MAAHEGRMDQQPVRHQDPASPLPLKLMILAEGAMEVFAASATKCAIRLPSSTSGTFHAGERRRATAAVPYTRLAATCIAATRRVTQPTIRLTGRRQALSESCR